MIHLALLRGVNVGGHRPIPMADLRAFLAELGMGEARSLLQSGNLVFRSGQRTGAGLERFLEAEAEKRLGLRTTFHVRTADEWREMVAENPFPAEAMGDPGHLVAMFFRSAPVPARVQALRAASTGPEKIRVAGRQAYLFYPEGIGRSRLTGALIEKHLGPRGTARNWNTVLKLGALAQIG